MNIKVGEYTVYESGCVITHLGKPVVFQIEDLTFEFNFVNDTENTESRANVLAKNNSVKNLVFTFFNYDNELGRGIKEPVNVGNIESSELYLQYFIYAIGNSNSKIIKYTWLTKKKNEEANK